MQDPPDVFLSYASRDLPHARAIHAHLSPHFRVWFDKHRLNPGCEWHCDIQSACRAARVVVPILTPAWKDSLWTRFETYGAEFILPIWVEGNREEVAIGPLVSKQFVDLRRDDAAIIAEAIETLRVWLRQPIVAKVPGFVSTPIRPDPGFVGREALLVSLHETLCRAPTAVLTQGSVQVISGLGGVGKTTLARQYAERYWRLYHDILWVTADPETIAGQFAKLAGDLRWVDRPGGIEADAAVALRELNGPTRRLLILDNADSDRSLADWIPGTGGCHTLITSRVAVWPNTMNTIPVDALSPEESRAFLVNRLGTKATPPEAVDQLCRELGGLPLALEQAAALMLEMEMSAGRYLEEYTQSRREILDEHKEGSTRYPYSVYRTWEVTTRRLGPLARMILETISFLAPDAIDPSWLESPDLWGEALGQPPSLLTIRRALAELKRYSMITWRQDAFSIHRLVQVVTADQLDTSKQARAAGLAARLVNAVFPRGEPFANWAMCARLLPHVYLLKEAWSRLQMEPRAMGRLLCEAGSYLRQRYQLDEAEPLVKLSLDIRRAALGAEHEEVADSLYQLGWVLQRKKQLPAANPLYRQALAIYEKTTGKDSPTYADVLDNLGVLHDDLSQHTVAEMFYLESLAIRTRLFGAASEDVAISHHNLATNLRDRGLLKQAEERFRLSVQTFRDAGKSRIPNMAVALWSLAHFLEARGRLREADPVRLEALDIRRESLGVADRETLEALRGLLILRRRLGENVDDLCRDYADEIIRRLGTDHPGLATVRGYQALLAQARSRPDQAEAFYREAMEILEKSPGSRWEELAEVCRQLESLCTARGDTQEALRFRQRRTALTSLSSSNQGR